MPESWILFPNQLFKSFLNLSKDTKFLLVEEPLYFSHQSRSTTFAKIKLAHLRACFKSYENRLQAEGFQSVNYLSYRQLLTQNSLEDYLLKFDTSFNYFHTNDHALERKLASFTRVQLKRHNDSPYFLYKLSELEEYLGAEGEIKNPFFQTTFYRHFRSKYNILMNKNGTFVGGKLSFDSENRKPMPKTQKIPFSMDPVRSEEELKYWIEAKEYVSKEFPNNPGNLDIIDSMEKKEGLTAFFPLTHEGAEEHLNKFLKERLSLFGPFQDAIQSIPPTKPNDLQLQQGTLFHSTISPMLNCGLLTAWQVVEAAVLMKDLAPIASLEGFIRQMMGWREFMRFVYLFRYDELWTSNQLKAENRLSSMWYEGRTGVKPVDEAIKFAFRYGYLHHIIRLMIMANFMTLTRLHPQDIYRWFLDFSLDSYDWVMVGNVCGMGTYASPILSTKPYISASNYILKMSNYGKGDWVDLWDGLYYMFLLDNRDQLNRTGRMGLVMSTLDKRAADRKNAIKKASSFLDTLNSVNEPSAKRFKE